MATRLPKAGWVLREGFRQWYHAPTREEAEQRLAPWEKEVREHGPAPFHRLFPTRLGGRQWRKETLNYFDHLYTPAFGGGYLTPDEFYQRWKEGLSDIS